MSLKICCCFLFLFFNKIPYLQVEDSYRKCALSSNKNIILKFKELQSTCINTKICPVSLIRNIVSEQNRISKACM